MWRRQDVPGLEIARLSQNNAEWEIEGSVLVRADGRAGDLRYLITCDSEWRTRTAEVDGFMDEERVSITIAADGNGTWLLNDAPVDAVQGCIDVDLGFTPSTNLLPIRRLNINSEPADVTAAWLRFPGMTLEPLSQRYTPLTGGRFRYTSANGFIAELAVDELGLVTRYGNYWQEISQ